MKLTVKEQEAVWKAVNDIADGTETCSCTALYYAAGLDYSCDEYSITEKYCDFYEKRRGDFWLHKEQGNLQDLRVLLLLTFLEVCS